MANEGLTPIGRSAPPRAAMLVEALRGLGYSTATALADIVDNSIAAEASRIDVAFTWNGERSCITVVDDGVGMSDAELERAMRLGEIDPRGPRALGDLGRFGMGLKTASFSQCRRLTVASKKSCEQRENCLRWDLDHLASANDHGWILLEGIAPGSEMLLDPLREKARGTVVLWEVLDRIVTAGYREQDFVDLIDRVEFHLGMVFHQFIAGSARRVAIYLNGRPVPAWDPFMISHTATWSSPEEIISTPTGPVVVQCHVLPHRDRLDERQIARTGGPDGWTSHQGFYVYRNRRLLVAGSWLGLGRGRPWTKEEAFRLARIRLELTNAADADWKIDIRKAVARPPVALRERLTRLAEDTRERARRVFAHRGQVNRAGGGGVPIEEAWRAEHTKAGVRYRIDESHAAVRAVLEQAGELEAQIRMMLRVIEETVPVQRIWLDTTEASETPRSGFAADPPADVLAVLKELYRGMVLKRGMAPEVAKERLRRTEPFHRFPELINQLPDEMPRE